MKPNLTDRASAPQQANAPTDPPPSRRAFLQRGGAVTAGGVLAGTAAFPGAVRAKSPGDTIKVGLIGCGGRGTGAAQQAMSADPDVQLTAMGDAFESQLNNSLNTLQRQKESKVAVDPEHRFVGLDAYQKVIDSGVDMVILTTPPGFRPQHLKAAVAAGKHVFCEKPVATDAPGVRSVLETAKEAKRKNLSLVCGFCWRFTYSLRETFARMHDGMIGDIVAYYATYYTGVVKPMPPEEARRPEWSDTEWQVRNWYNFTWLSGDSLVEQAVHSADKVAWAMKDAHPLTAVATGGRQIPSPGGNIFDHFHINYEYPEGVRAFLGSRQQSRAYGENADFMLGSKGRCNLRGPKPFVTSEAEGKWTYRGKGNNMYQTEHDELFASIRKGEPINNGEWMANSTMLAIMGRMAAYTGQKITWEQAINSQEKLVPDELDWDGELPVRPRSLPGKTPFV